MEPRFHLEIFVDLRCEKCIFIEKIEREQAFSLKFYFLEADFGHTLKNKGVSSNSMSRRQSRIFSPLLVIRS